MSDVREQVREHYRSAALEVLGGGASSCGCEGCCDDRGGPGAALYDPRQREELPDAALLASLGCGNPTAVAALREGEVVLDLGSGGGIDVILSARRVGPTGRAYGLDMTEEMLELARRNAAEAGVDNVEFLEGYMEDVPLPDASVDVIISNCVINLSPDKDAVFRESHRVLKPGGRFHVSDVVLQRDLSAAEKDDLALWAGCASGALLEADYLARLRAAGFAEARVDSRGAIGDKPWYSATISAFKAAPKLGCC